VQMRNRSIAKAVSRRIKAGTLGTA
jgi:hypothetical protein